MTREELQDAADAETLCGPLTEGCWVDGAFGELHLRDKLAADLATYAPFTAARIEQEFTGENGYDDEEDGEALDEHINALDTAWNALLAPHGQQLVLDCGDAIVCNIEEEAVA